MDSQKALNQYLEQSVQTASPGQLTLMLYNGCVKQLHLAGKAIEAEDAEAAGCALIKAQRIVHELRGTLDDRYETANRLRPLYDFVLDTLVTANMRKSRQKVEDAAGIMTGLREAWAQAIRIKDQPPGQAAI